MDITTYQTESIEPVTLDEETLKKAIQKLEKLTNKGKAVEVRIDNLFWFICYGNYVFDKQYKERYLNYDPLFCPMS